MGRLILPERRDASANPMLSVRERLKLVEMEKRALEGRLAQVMDAGRALQRHHEALFKQARVLENALQVVADPACWGESGEWKGPLSPREVAQGALEDVMKLVPDEKEQP